MKVKVKSCPTLWDPMDCSLPGFSVHGILQARTLEWVAISFSWKILKEMGIPDHLICLLRKLYAGQEATVRSGHGTTDWFQIGKSYLDFVKAVYCDPAYLTYMQSTSWETLGWKKHKLESILPGEISITLDMQMTPPLWQKSESEVAQSCLTLCNPKDYTCQGPPSMGFSGQDYWEKYQ